MKGFAKRLSSIRAAAIAISCCLVMVAACGGGDGESTSSGAVDEISGMSEDELYKAAQEEGSVMWYSTMPVESTEAALAGFSKKYPGIKTEYIRAPTGELWQRYQQEFHAGRNKPDVLNFSDFGTIKSTVDQKMVVPYIPASVQEGLKEGIYPEQSVDPDGYWFNMRLYLVAFVYNTDLVKGDDIPKTYDDWTKPFWKGKLGAGDPKLQAAFPTAYDALLTQLGLGEDYWRAVGENKPTLYNDSGSFANAVLTGEVAGGMGVDYGAWEQAASGAPIGVALPEDGVAYSTDFYMLAAKAPHPHAGALLLDYLGSAEGATQVQKTGSFTMVRNDVATDGPGRPPTDEIKLLHPDFEKMADPKQYENIIDQWHKWIKGNG